VGSDPGAGSGCLRFDPDPLAIGRREPEQREVLLQLQRRFPEHIAVTLLNRDRGAHFAAQFPEFLHRPVQIAVDRERRLIGLRQQPLRFEPRADAIPLRLRVGAEPFRRFRAFGRLRDVLGRSIFARNVPSSSFIARGFGGGPRRPIASLPPHPM
jgi:hypothetical protein